MDNNENILSSNELVNATSNEVLFERIIENIINNYVDNNHQTQPINEQQNIPRQTNNQQYVENMSMIHALRDVLVGYNTNMREYQENIRNFLNIIHTTQLSVNTQNQYFSQPQPQPQPESHPPQQTYSGPPQQTQQRQPPQNRTGRTTMYNIRQSRNRLFASPSNNRTSFTLRPIQTTPRNPMNNRPIVSENQQPQPQPQPQPQQQQQPQQQTQQIPSIISSILNNDASILFSDRPIINRLGRTFFNNLRDVLVYPSQAQITNATRNIEFSDSSANMNTSCPITLDEFQNGDIVRQIIPCGHIFQEPALRNWFTRNVRCPVCRYDIRDYIQQPSSDRDSDSDSDNVDHNIGNLSSISGSQRTNDTADNVNRIVNNIINNTSRTLDEMLNSYMNNYIDADTNPNPNPNANADPDADSITDISNNLIYRIEIPLYYDEYYDASDNYLGMGDLLPEYE